MSLDGTGCYSCFSQNSFSAVFHQHSKEKGGNLLPINIRIKLLNLGEPRRQTSEAYSPLFYIICFHQGTKTDKKPTTHTYPLPWSKKGKAFFFVKNIFTEGPESPHSRQVLLNSIFSEEVS